MSNLTDVRTSKTKFVVVFERPGDDDEADLLQAAKIVTALDAHPGFSCGHTVRFEDTFETTVTVDI